MGNSNSSLIIYGIPGSQPTRVLFWACLLKQLPFTVGASQNDLFFTDDTNPRGQIPAIVDGDFRLAEMGAIVHYLADKHGWSDLYPRDLQVRARIQEFLHRYHSLVRLATYKLMATFVVKPLAAANGNDDSPGVLARHVFTNPYSILFRDLFKVSFSTDKPLEEGGQAVRAIADFLEKNDFSGSAPFLCNAQSPSIADLVCYSELGQLQIANLFDFGDYPGTLRWLSRMSEVPYHDTIHAYNIALGDLVSVPNTPERLKTAVDAGFKALEKTGLVTVMYK